MELQKKFEEIINTNIIPSYAGELMYVDEGAKDCVKLCLEEQIKVLKLAMTFQNPLESNSYIVYCKSIMERLQQQLNELEDGR